MILNSLVKLNEIILNDETFRKENYDLVEATISIGELY